MIDLGVKLMLLAGPTLPLPVPGPIADALLDVEVRTAEGGRDGFQLTFGISKDGPADYSLVQSGFFDPLTRVSVAVLYGASPPEVLIDGVVTDHQVVASERPGQSTFVVTGEDLSLLLDLEDTDKSYPNQADWMIVKQLLVPFLRYGMLPDVTETSNFPIELQRIPSQQQSALGYIKQLADDNGYVFFLEPVTIGVTRAYWGPPPRLGLPQRALTVDMGAMSNVEGALTGRYQAMRPEAPQVTIVEPMTQIAIDIPVPAGLRPPLSLRPAKAFKKRRVRESAKLASADAVQRAFAEASATADAVTLSGEVDAVRYGTTLRARQLVGVRGAGFSYDGVWAVQQVSHRLRRGEYKQQFTLTRDGHGSLTPALPT